MTLNAEKNSYKHELLQPTILIIVFVINSIILNEVEKSTSNKNFHLRLFILIKIVYKIKLIKTI